MYLLVFFVFAITVYQLFAFVFGSSTSVIDSIPLWRQLREGEWRQLQMNTLFLLLPWLLLILFLLSLGIAGISDATNLAQKIQSMLPYDYANGAILGTAFGLLIATVRYLQQYRETKPDSPSPWLNRAIQSGSYLIAVLVGAVFLSSLQGAGLDILDRISKVNTPVGGLELREVEQANNQFESGADVAEFLNDAQGSRGPAVFGASNLQPAVSRITSFYELLEGENRYQEDHPIQANKIHSKIVPNTLDLFENYISLYARCVGVLYTLEPDEQLVRQSFRGFLTPLRALVSGDFLSVPNTTPIKILAYDVMLNRLAKDIKTLRRTVDTRGFRSLQFLFKPEGDKERTTAPCELLSDERLGEFSQRRIQKAFDLTIEEIQAAEERPYLSMLLALLLEVEGQTYSAVSVLDRWARNAEIILQDHESALNGRDHILRRQIILVKHEMLALLGRYSDQNPGAALILPQLAEQHMATIENFIPAYNWRMFYKKRNCKMPFGDADNFDRKAKEAGLLHVKAKAIYLDAIRKMPRDYSLNLHRAIERADLLYTYLTSCKSSDMSERETTQSHRNEFLKTLRVLGNLYLDYSSRIGKAGSILLSYEDALTRANDLFSLCETLEPARHTPEFTNAKTLQLLISEALAVTGTNCATGLKTVRLLTDG